MSQTANQSSPQTPREPSRVLRTVMNLLRMLVHNWPTKLLALVLAVALWGGLITQDPDLTREKTFRDVSVTISGSDTLKRNGLVVTSDLEALLDQVTVKAEVPQMQYANAQATNYSIRIDLSRIKKAGEQEVSIVGTNSITFGEVTEISPRTVTVMVEEYVAEGFIPVNVVKVGQAPEGFYASEPTCEPTRITVSGPRTLVEKIVRAEVLVDLSTLPAREGLVEEALSFRLLDADGAEIVSDMLQVTSNTVLRTRVNVSTQLYVMGEVELQADALYKGRPADGWEVAEVIVSPDVVTVAGRRSIVESIKSLGAKTPLSISGKSENVTGVVDLSIPVNLQWYSDSQVDVTVVIKPIREERHFAAIPLSITNVPDGMTAAGPYTAFVTVTGPQAWVQSLSRHDLSVTCDVMGLEPGVHELPLTCTIEGSEGQEFTVDVEPMTVRVTITPRD